MTTITAIAQALGSNWDRKLELDRKGLGAGRKRKAEIERQQNRLDAARQKLVGKISKIAPRNEEEEAILIVLASREVLEPMWDDERVDLAHRLLESVLTRKLPARRANGLGLQAYFPTDLQTPDQRRSAP